MSTIGAPDRWLAVLQPGYLPWLGFFDQILRSDIFVYYDDVPYDKHGWRNRNRIKTPAGPMWLTVPVIDKGRHGQFILEAEIDNQLPWARKHLGSIRQFYNRAPYFEAYYPELESLLGRPWRYLIDLDLALIERLCEWLDVRGTIIRASDLHIGGERSERLLNFCKHFGADHYLSGNAAQDYLDVARFTAQGVQVEWQNYRHPIYPQMHGAFLSHLSALDLLLNAGPTSSHILRGEA